VHTTNNTPFPSMGALHHAITAMGRLVAGRDGGPSVAVDPDSIHRSILLVEGVVGLLIPTRVEDQPLTGRVMMRWVRPWGELLVEVPAHRERYVYHLYPHGALGSSGEVSSVTQLLQLLMGFVMGPQSTVQEQPCPEVPALQPYEVGGTYQGYNGHTHY
jgi:hypothetical protein